MLFCGFLHAQDWKWYYRVDAKASAGGVIKTDQKGNVYVWGGLSSPTATFNGTNGSVIKSSLGAFLLKYDHQGNILAVSGANSKLYWAFADFDATGNCYVTGSFSDTAWIGRNNDTLIRSTPRMYDNFLAKVDSSGKALFFIGMNDSCSNPGRYIITLDNGDAIQMGWGPAYCNPTAPANSRYITRIKKLDGSMTWTLDANTFIFYNEHNTRFAATRDTGFLIVGNYYFDTTTFKGITTAITLPYPGKYSDSCRTFVAKYSGSGEIEWVKTIPRNPGGDIAKITTDSHNNIYFSIRSDGVSHYTNVGLGPNSKNRAHVIKTDANGTYKNHLTLDPRASVTDIKVDSRGNVYLSVTTDTTLYIQSSKVTEYISNATRFYSVIKLDSNFNYIWSTVAKGFCNCEGLISLTDSVVFFMINNDGGITFNQTQFVSDFVYHKCIVAAIRNGNEKMTSISEHQTTTFSLFPNPSSGIFNINSSSRIGKYSISVYSTNGIRLLSEELKNAESIRVDLTGYSKGVYFLEVKNDSGREMKKIVIQ